MFVAVRRNWEAIGGHGVASVEDDDNRSLDYVSLLVEWDMRIVVKSSNTWSIVDMLEG